MKSSPLRRVVASGSAVAVGLALAATLTSPTQAVPSAGQPLQQEPTHLGDALPSPLSDKQSELRKHAVAQVLQGELKPTTINGNKVVKVGREPTATSSRETRRGSVSARTTQNQYVELENERTDKVFVFLVEFGDERHPDYPDQDTDPSTSGPTKFAGPAFNEIPEPPADDNATQWRSNYGKGYFRKLYFGTGDDVESLRTYYERQSSGRYSVKGNVTDFTKVRYNQARYGRSDGYPCGGVVCSNTWALIEDGMTQWVADQKAAGLTDGQIRWRLRQYDIRDRYDYDGDGNFDEPDGYLDRFQIVHAGGDQADGDPLYGEDAIWSHRWYTNFQGIGSEGPAQNPAGGLQIGNSDMWIGDYTMQPENGGLSVVAHEYGHDLGLPDHYDTVTGGNPASWWTLMAQSRLSAEGDRGIGTRPGDLGVWDKLQLGWLDYETVVAGQKRNLVLGPHEYNSTQPQALAMVLPDKEVPTELTVPAEGSAHWWSGGGDAYQASMSRSDLAVPAAGGTLSLSVNYNIEEDYDFAYLEVESPAGSDDWTVLPTDALDPDGAGEAADPGIDGVSDGYVEARYDLGDYAGGTIGFRARYLTDGAVQGQDPNLTWSGIFVDDIAITSGGGTVFEDGAENPPNGWEIDGFASVGAEDITRFDQFYLASHRDYLSYDRYLETGPYHFGYPAQPKRVDHFPYQDGLLVNYWDTSFSDNNTSQHSGGGMVLPVDSQEQVKYNLEGRAWGGGIQDYDAPFTTEKADSFTLHVNGKPSYVRGEAGNPLFTDADPDRYYTPFADAGLAPMGVKVAGVGVKIKVLNVYGKRIRVRVS